MVWPFSNVCFLCFHSLVFSVLRIVWRDRKEAYSCFEEKQEKRFKNGTSTVSSDEESSSFLSDLSYPSVNKFDKERGSCISALDFQDLEGPDVP